MFRRGFLALLMVVLAVSFAAAEDLTLDQAISLALSQSRALQAAQHGKTAADWGLARGISSWLPKVTYSWGWFRYDDQTYDDAEASYQALKRVSADAERSVWKNNYSNSIEVAQPIFNQGGEYVAIRAAAINRRSARHQEDDARFQVILDVKQTYYAALKAQALARVAAESLSLAEESLRLVQARLEVGSATKSDVLRWEAELAGAEGNVVEAENAYAQSLMQLARLIGGSVRADWTLPELSTDTDQVDLSIAEMAGKAGREEPLGIGEHPAMRTVDDGLELSHVEAEQSVGNLLPSVNFSYGYNWSTDDTPAPDDETSWTMGVGVAIPLFQGFGAATGVGQSVYQYRQAKVEADDYRRQFLQRAYAAQLDLRSARLRVLSARKAVMSSQANLEIVAKRAELGMATNLEQLDAQIAYQSAQSELIGAVSDFHIALAEWDYVTQRTEE